MLDQTVCTYERHKKEAKRILNRITLRHNQELAVNRSQGYEIIEDLQEQLRKTCQRAQTHYIGTKLLRPDQNHRFKKFPSLNLAAVRRATFLSQNIEVFRDKLSLNNHQILNSNCRNSAKVTCKEKDYLQSTLLQMRNSLKSQKFDLKGDQIQNVSKLVESRTRPREQDSVDRKQGSEEPFFLDNYKQNKIFLPMLEMYAQELSFLSSMSQQEERTHSIITQMLILALARRKHGKLLDALDILVRINSFFPSSQTQMQHLKMVWYELIATVFLEINSQEKKEKASRWKRTSKVNSFKAQAQMKRQKTIVIRTLASKRNFMERVSLQLQKMDLVHETNYQSELRSCRNIVQDQQKGKSLISRVSKDYILSYPEPSDLFPQVGGIEDYGLVIITRDRLSNLFPNHYPVALAEMISQELYVSTLCKVNSVLVPETRCFDYKSWLHCNYQSIFTITLLLFLAVVFICVLIPQDSQSTSMTALVACVFVLVGILSFKIHNSSYAGFGRSNASYRGVKRILNELQERLEASLVRFTLSDNVDMIIISFPKEAKSQSFLSEQNEYTSQEHFHLPQKLKTLRCSSSLKFLQQINNFMRTSETQTEETKSIIGSSNQIDNDKLTQQIEAVNSNNANAD